MSCGIKADSLPQISANVTSAERVKIPPPPSENYVQAPQAPWSRPSAYLNLNETWSEQKPFRL